MVDISVRIESEMKAADTAQSVGNHSARAEHATNALKMLQSEYDALHRPTPSTKPENGVEASARLQHLTSGRDQDWSRRFAAGDPAARREFDELAKQAADADPIEMAIAGVAPPDSVDENNGAIPNGRDLVAGVKHMRELGYSDMNIGEVLTGQLRANDGRPITAEETAARVADAERALDRAMRNPEFRRALLNNDPDARREFDWVCGIITAGKK